MTHLGKYSFPIIRLANSISVSILDKIAIKALLSQENYIYYDKLSYYDVYLIETSYLVVFLNYPALLFKNYEDMVLSVVEQQIQNFYDEEKGLAHPMFYFNLPKEATHQILSNNYLPINLELISDYIWMEFHGKIFRNHEGNCLVKYIYESSALFLNEEEMLLYYKDIERLAGLAYVYN